MNQNLLQQYSDYCKSLNIPYKHEQSVLSYDDTTLFCPSGMQQYKKEFSGDYTGTLSNVQPCIRLNDLDEIGDGTHLLYFNMMGLFSFKTMTVKEAIDFWFGFFNLIGLQPDYVTVHPDRIEWKSLYDDYNIEVRLDPECTWSDGNISGYCTEFYKNDIEIGNIVNPLGHSIDCGFGLERISQVMGSESEPLSEVYKQGIMMIIESGIRPSNTKQGYILRKLLRKCYSLDIIIDHGYYRDELERQIKVRDRYERLKHKNKDKSPEWWFDTHGIDVLNL